MKQTYRSPFVLRCLPDFEVRVTAASWESSPHFPSHFTPSIWGEGRASVRTHWESRLVLGLSISGDNPVVFDGYWSSGFKYLFMWILPFRVFPLEMYPFLLGFKLPGNLLPRFLLVKSTICGLFNLAQFVFCLSGSCLLLCGSAFQTFVSLIDLFKDTAFLVTHLLFLFCFFLIILVSVCAFSSIFICMLALF